MSHESPGTAASPERFLSGDGFGAIEIVPDAVPLLQRFFDANPDYFLAVNGEIAGVGEAHEEVHGSLPDGWPFTRKWVFAIAGGAAWLRLGVVAGNARAEKFWESAGFVEVRRREGVAMGRKVNTVRVMVKPLAGGTLPAYLALVARDHPDAA